MNSIAAPIQTFAVSIWRIERCLEIFDPLRRTTQAENTFDIGSYATVS